MTGRPEPSNSILGRIAGVLLAFFPPAALLGPWAGIGPVFVYRVLTVVLAGCALAGWIRPSGARRGSRGAAAMILIAVVWGVVGLVGAAQLGTRRELSSFVGAGLALMGAWAVTRLIADGHLSRPRALRDLAFGWAVAMWIGTPVAGWEICTGRHLSTYISGLWRNHPGLYRQPATWLTNPNLYAVFVAVGLVFVGAVWAGEQCLWVRVVAGATVILGVGLVAATGSRLAQIALALALMVRLWAVTKWRWVLPTLTVVAVAVILMTHAQQAGLAWHRFVGVLVHHNDEGPSSFSARTALMAWGLALVAAHPLIGAGPGGFRAAIIDQPRRWFTHGKSDPHNGVLEIASQYGLVVTVMLAVCWVWGIVSCWRHRQWWSTALLIVIPVLSLANSTYLVQSVTQLTWLLSAVVLVHGDRRSKNGCRADSR
ncbi:O-antigen ligase family protein [Cutibacterium avidum]|uniref:O-antigen ligase family protein n=1 Tax=Cutibacterium avidum TaxID=33010 RepID=UPI00192B044D|nr:O-antigen ligase family protein [Cutibacterium avidum]QQY15902.1 O-antigen ligase family protein [Cutibacterium avidum]